MKRAFSIKQLGWLTIILLFQDVTASEDLSLDELMKAYPDPYADVDMKAILDRYGTTGSGLEISSSPLAIDRSGRAAISSEALKVSGGISDIKEHQTGWGFTVNLAGDYLFEFDKYDLTPEAEQALEDVYGLYQEYEGTDIDIAGHTDSKGSNEYNQTLSEERAESVGNWFVSKGIDPSLVTTKGYGETNPIADNERNGEDYPEGRALNRRVEIVITTEKKVNHISIDN